MTTFTRTWDAAYETVPADSEDARLGAQRIRELKNDISERGEVDHSWAGDGNDGAHKKVTLIEQAGNPSTVANTGYLYTKDVSGITECYYMDSAGTVTQLTSAGALNPALVQALMQKQTGVAYTTAGTSTAFTLTPSPAITAYTENMEFDVEFHTASGATPTLQVSGVASPPLLKYRDTDGAKQAVTSIQIPTGWRSKVTHDGTDWIVREVAELPLPLQQNSRSANYTATLTDANNHIYHPSSDNNARTFTIPANSSVAYPVGTTITFVNKINTVTIAITTDTLTWAGAGTTGSRTLAANGMATALKVTTTEWFISGSGLS